MITILKNQFWNGVFLRYVAVGILGTLTDVVLLALLVETSAIDPHTSPFFFIFTTVSFLAAVIQNFILNKWWTFGSTEKKKTQREFIKFMIVALIGLGLSNAFMFLFVVQFVVWYIYAKLLTSMCVLVWNFLGNKYWTFRAIRIAKKIVPALWNDEIEYSIIIPAYNEENRLPDTLAKVTEFLKTFPHVCEVVVVDDGSSDRTSEVAAKFFQEHVLAHARVITCTVNRGKGHAVRMGVLEGVGKYILFTDADNSTPIEELARFAHRVDESDILIGSRYIPGSKVAIYQPWYRVMLGRASNFVIRSFLVDEIRDTQCGFKLFSRDAAKDIFARSTVDGFGFDMEALALADALGYSIQEVPVSWFNSEDSRVRPVKDTVRTLRELIAIKLRLWGGKYH